MADIEAGRIDCVVVYKVDRLSRSLLDFAKMLEVFERHHVAFVSVTQQFNRTTSMGRLMLNVLLSLAQFERRLIQERTKAGLAAARARGRMGGRPKTSPQDAKVRLAKTLLADKSLEVDDICETLKISRSTLYRYANL